MKTLLFCNNCGKQGHVFHICKQPIISNGLIAFRREPQSVIDKEEFGFSKKIEYLMIRRKDTLGFVDFMRGRYSLFNKTYLMNIINEMTIKEKIKLKSKEFDELWKDLWMGTSASQYRNEGRVSKEKFISLKKGVLVNGEEITIDSLIKESQTRWVETEWGFPKGRRNHNEKDLVCGIREFTEETGYNKEDLKIVQNISPYEEIFTGSNFKSYKHKYFLANIGFDVETTDGFQKSEVSEMKWMTFDECLEKIRPYNYEKIDILRNVNKILNTYRIY
jgi:8-oxo-dGTP pyrophosphatase MutT (NUDIX family)